MPAPTNKSFSLLNALEAKEYKDDVVKPFFFFIIMDALINTKTNSSFTFQFTFLMQNFHILNTVEG